MIPLCLILGDSTAVGTAAALAERGMRCEIHARVGAHSDTIAREWQGGDATPVALIALGSNDAGDPMLGRTLAVLRGRMRARRVIWLAPYRASAALAVSTVATRFGDTVLALAALPTRDGIHPASYRPIATMLGWQSLFGHGDQASAPIQPSAPSLPSRPIIRRAVVLRMDQP